MAVRVLLRASPGTEEIQTGLDVEVGAASLVPLRSLLYGTRTGCIADGEILQAQRDIECALIQIRCRVDLRDYILPGSLARVERRGVGAVGSNTNKRYLARVWTALGGSDAGEKINAGRIAASRKIIKLTLSQNRPSRRR